MATTNPRRELATITIPAAYLDDVRAALANEIREDGDRLCSDREDRAGAAQHLHRDMHVFDQLLDASGDAEITASHDTFSSPLVAMLEAMVRELVGRLREEMDYAPLDMAAVRELADRLRWAADEALRIQPGLDPAFFEREQEARS